MKLYHGSKLRIEKPRYQGSKEENDYGPAFYLTKDIKSAHEWACRNNSVGIINQYELNIQELKILDLTDKKHFSVFNWLAILLHFRTLDTSFINPFKVRLQYIEENYYIDVSNYDLIIGFRADDAYFRFPLDFVRGNLTLEQLEQSFNLGNLGIQYVIISQKGINQLSFIGSFPSEEKYIDQYFISVTKVTKTFDSLSKDEDGTRIIDIMREKQ